MLPFKIRDKNEELKGKRKSGQERTLEGRWMETGAQASHDPAIDKDTRCARYASLSGVLRNPLVHVENGMEERLARGSASPKREASPVGTPVLLSMLQIRTSARFGSTALGKANTTNAHRSQGHLQVDCANQVNERLGKPSS